VMARIWVNGLAWLMAGCLWISLAAVAQGASTRTGQDAFDLLTKLLSPETPDIQWSATEKALKLYRRASHYPFSSEKLPRELPVATPTLLTTVSILSRIER
jgi:hypothetical protein